MPSKLFKNFRILTIAVILTAFISVACASQTPSPSDDFELPDFSNPRGGSFEFGNNRVDTLAGLGLNDDSSTRKNVSEINIDVDSVTPSAQRYLFVINRGDNQVRIANADSSDGLKEPGDILATLTVDVIDPDIFTASANPDGPSTIFGFIVDYDSNSLRILSSDGLDIPSRSEGPHTATTQIEASGVRATLTVENIESRGPDNPDTPTGSSGSETYASRDRHEALIDLSGQPDAGAVKINIRIQDSEPPVAALSPQQETGDGQDTRDDAPQPETDDRQNSSQNSESDDRQPNVGQDNPASPDSSENANNDSGNAGQGGISDSPPNDPTPKEGDNSQQESPPEDELDDEIRNDGSGDGSAFAKNYDVVLMIDSSTSVLQSDRSNYRGLAARALLSAVKPGDQIGLVHFIEYVEYQTLKPIEYEGRVRSRGTKRDLINALEDNVTLRGTGWSNIDRALGTACDLLENGRSPNRAAILISDGDSNLHQSVGADHQCFADNDWEVFILGIAEPKAGLLGEIAENTEGEVIANSGPQSLVCELQRIRAALSDGLNPPCLSQQASPFRDTAFSVTVPPGQSQATFTITWADDNTMRTSLKPPSGTPFPGRVFIPAGMQLIHDYDQDGKLFEIYTVINPEPGSWMLKIDTENGVLFDAQDVVFGFSTLPNVR